MYGGGIVTRAGRVCEVFAAVQAWGVEYVAEERRIDAGKEESGRGGEGEKEVEPVPPLLCYAVTSAVT